MARYCTAPITSRLSPYVASAAWLATLDSKTCALCGPLHLTVYPYDTRARQEALKRPVKRTGNYTKAQQAALGAERLESFGEVVERLLTAQADTRQQ